MSRHYVEDARLLRAAGAAFSRRREEEVGGYSDFLADLRNWLGKQPTAPDLLGATEAAKILGVQTPHVTRLREQGRMPEGIPIAGSVEAYLRDEVEELAAELRAERDARRRRRAERSTG